MCPQAADKIERMSELILELNAISIKGSAGLMLDVILGSQLKMTTSIESSRNSS